MDAKLDFRPVYGSPHFKSKPGEFNPIINALLQRKPGTEEVVLIARGKVFTSTRETKPTIDDLRESPNEILFVTNPTIHMWVAALKSEPELAKFSPLICGNTSFIRAYTEITPIRCMLLLHLPAKTSRRYISNIIERINLRPDELGILLHWFPYRPRIDTIMRSIEAYVGRYETNNGKMGHFCWLESLYDTIQDQEYRIDMIITCIRLQDKNDVGYVQPMLTYMLQGLNYEGDIDRLLIALSNYISNHVCGSGWLNDIIGTMPKTIIPKFIHELQKRNIIVSGIKLKYIDFGAFRQIKMSTEQEKIKAIEAICKDIESNAI